MDERRNGLIASCSLAVTAILAIVVILPLDLDGRGHQLDTILFLAALSLAAVGCHCLERRDDARADGYRKSL